MSPPIRSTSEGGFREEVFNVFLAILLSDRGILSVPENIRKITSKTRRIPDVTITEFWGVRVIIEGRIFEAPTTEHSLISDARKRIEEGLSPVCIAVLYPSELRTINWTEIKARLEQVQLRTKVLTDSYEGEWFDTDVDGLAAILRRTYELLVREDVVLTVVEQIKAAIENASSCLLEIPAIPDRLRTILGVFGERNAGETRKDDLRVCRIASLTLANALIFQEVLASHEPTVKTIRRTLDESDLVTAFSKVWRHILDDINYIPIFRVAREILLELPSGPGTEKALHLLADVALETTKQRAALKHDLMGRIYHRLLVDAKYFGAFYTTIPAATLLLELTFDPKYWDVDFSNQDEIRSLKLADLACGTGTLLKAALEAIVDDYVKAVIESNKNLELVDLHKMLVEETLWGFDVLPFATHLAASTLALHEPDVPFDRMNLYVLPLGGPSSRLGSLDFLSNRVVPLQMDLFGALLGPSRVTGQGDESVALRMFDLDLCVMNPPFTRSVGGNLLFGAYPADQRRSMQARLKRIIRRDKVKANITAGLGSVFVALADKYLKNTGHMALVLPKSLLSGIAWERTRRLLTDQYRVRYIIVSHEPNAWNFSENTDLSECLVVADKIGNSNISDSCHIVNLWRKPRSNVEALTLSSLILTASPVRVDDTGICELVLETTKYGELISIPSTEFQLWSYCTAFAQTDLARAAYHLSKGSLYLPGSGVVSEISTTTLGSLCTIGPDRRDIHDGFNLSPEKTTYPAIWGHDSDKIKTIKQTRNRFLSPLSKAKRGRTLRDPTLLWGRNGRLLIAERIWMHTHRLFSIWCPNRVLSNVWWTLRVKRSNHEDVSDPQLEKIMSIWLNSTLGAIQLLSARTETRGAWIDFKKPNLKVLPIVDPYSLTPDQIQKFDQLFESVSSKPLLSWKEAAEDKTRQFIDDEISRILGLPDYGILRTLLASEPMVTLSMCVGR